jgi:hypothetical protein
MGSFAIPLPVSHHIVTIELLHTQINSRMSSKSLNVSKIESFAPFAKINKCQFVQILTICMIPVLIGCKFVAL